MSRPAADQTMVDQPGVDHPAEDQPEDEEVIGPEELEMAINDSAKAEQPGAFFFDLAGDSSIPKKKAPKKPVHIPERPSPQESSSSSDEVILFKGRDRQKANARPPTDIVMTQMREEIQVVEEQIRAEPAIAASRSAGRKKRDRASRRRKAGPQPRPKEEEDEEEDAWLADYIANMRESGEAESFSHQKTLNRRDLGGTESEVSSGEDEPQRVSKPRVVTAPPAGQEQGELDATAEGTGLSASELDDETLAKLIAGEMSGPDIISARLSDSESSSDDSDDKRGSKSRMDAYDDLDMDWERPSLRRKKGKGARAQMTFGVSDSELEATMEAAWSNDRLKKSQRKKQREEQRALGLLGKKTKPEDLMAKYPTGMKLEQVAEELKTFMLGNDEM